MHKICSVEHWARNKNNTYGLLFQDLDQNIFIDFSEIKITSDRNTIEANETTQMVMRDIEEFKTVHNLEKKNHFASRINKQCVRSTQDKSYPR